MTACSVQPTATGYKVAWREPSPDTKSGWRQPSRSFGTRREADRWAAVVRTAGIGEALRHLADENAPQHVVTLTEALAFHLSQIIVKPGTLLEYERIPPRTWGPTLGPLPVHVITKQRIVAWIKHAHQVEGKSPKTITNAHGLLSGVLTTAVEQGWLAANPCRGIRMPSGETTEKVWLSETEAVALIGELPEHWRPMVILIAATGMRLGEVTALQWRDVNWAAGTVRISRGWHKVGGTYVLSSPKTSRAVRTIRLPPLARAALQEAQGRQSDDARDAIIFRGEHGGTRVHPAWFREHIWHPARKRAKIDAKVTPHSLRDSHVAWQISRGTDLAVIQARLGHESIKTTIDKYGHLQADVLAASVDAAQDALSAIPSILPKV